MVFLLIGALVLLGIGGISVIYLRRRDKRLDGYSGLSREDFTKHFTAQGIPSDVSGAVYDTFKSKVKSDTFKPSPEMSIEAVFEQIGEDTDDDARHILKVLGIPKPTEEVLESWPGKDVQTVSDMVLWTDWVRRHR